MNIASKDKVINRPTQESLISEIEDIIEEARNGRMFILADDEDRENEGDLIIPAQMATPEAINFMATHGRGLICLSLTKDRIESLNLPLMSASNSIIGRFALLLSSISAVKLLYVAVASITSL